MGTNGEMEGKWAGQCGAMVIQPGLQGPRSQGELPLELESGIYVSPIKCLQD